MLAVFINIIDNMKTDKKFTFTVTQLLRTSKPRKHWDTVTGVVTGLINII